MSECLLNKIAGHELVVCVRLLLLDNDKVATNWSEDRYIPNIPYHTNYTTSFLALYTNLYTILLTRAMCISISNEVFVYVCVVLIVYVL